MTDKAQATSLDWENDEFVVGALLTLYGFQTLDEQADDRTSWENGMGFNALDAAPMSSLSKWYLDKGFLTEKQVSFARRCLKKYNGQLSGRKIPLLPISKNPKPTNGNGEPDYKKAGIKNEKIWIKFKIKDRSAFMEAVANVKTLTGRRFIKADSCWQVPMTLEAAERLIEWGYELAPALKEWADKMLAPIAVNENIEISGLRLPLRPFQKTAVAFIEARKGNALIGDEMGLGKTPEALAYLQLHPELRPAIIIPPGNVKYNWGREARRFMQSPELYVINGRYNPKSPEWQQHQITQSTTGEGPIIIVNYDVLRNKTKIEKVPDPKNPGKMKDKKVIIPNSGWADILANELDIKIVIADECHKIKNPQTLQSKAVKTLSKKSEQNLFMSGTPIENNAIEFFSTLNIVAPETFPAFWPYAHRYCNPKKSFWNKSGWEFKGVSNAEELHKKLENIMLRRLKKDVLPELPDQQRTVVLLEINNRKEYNRAADDIISWIAENCGTKAATKAKRAEAMVRFEKLKQLTIEGKLNSAIEWIEDYLEAKNKLVVFCNHKSTVKLLQAYFNKRAVTIDGSTSQKVRPTIVDAFQEDPDIQILIGTESAKEGITLTAAADTCTIELWWKPAWHDQADARVHRIGQTAKECTAYYLLAAETIEEDIAAILDTKRRVVTAILDGKEVEDEEILTELISRLVEGSEQ